MPILIRKLSGRDMLEKKDRKALVEPDNPEISKTRQCKLLGISRSTLYYAPKGFSDKD